MTDSEGITNTPTGLAALSTEFAILNVEDDDQNHDGFIKHPQYTDAHSLMRDITSVTPYTSSTYLKFATRITNRQYLQVAAMTLTEHRSVLYEELGFNEADALLVHWGICKVDVDTMGRIIHNKSSLHASSSEVKVDSPIVIQQPDYPHVKIRDE